MTLTLWEPTAWLVWNHSLAHTIPPTPVSSSARAQNLTLGPVTVGFSTELKSVSDAFVVRCIWCLHLFLIHNLLPIVNFHWLIAQRGFLNHLPQHGCRGLSGMKNGKNHHVCSRTAHQPSPAGTEVPQRVKAKEKNLSEPLKIWSDLWLESVHSVQCKQTAALQFNPSLFFTGAWGDEGSPSGSRCDPMNSCQRRDCLLYTEQGPALAALHPCLGVILGSPWIYFSSPPKQQENNSEFIRPEEIVHQVSNPWQRTTAVMMAGWGEIRALLRV